MFEKIRSPEAGQKLSKKLYGALAAMKLVEKDHIPEPFYALIEGEPWKFTYDDTHIARCEENPDFSSIVHVTRDESGEINGGASIYGQRDVMDDMEAQGFEVVIEELAEAEANYHLYHPRGNEQAGLN
jgi:hypothetical protein